MPFVLQLGLDGLVIFDNSVMDQGQQTVVPKMGVGVAVVGFTVGGPTGMAYAGMRMQGLTQKGIFQLGYLAFFLVNIQGLIEEGHTGTIVAPIF